MYSFLRRSQLSVPGKTIGKLHRFTLFNVRNYYVIQRLAVKAHTQVHTCDSLCVGSFISCSISFTLNRCDLTRVAQGYQAVTRIHLPSPGLAWPGLDWPGWGSAKSLVCLFFIRAQHFTEEHCKWTGSCWFWPCQASLTFLVLSSFLDQLFHVLAMHMRLYSIDLAYNPWTKLTQVTQCREAQWVMSLLNL